MEVMVRRRRVPLDPAAAVVIAARAELAAAETRVLCERALAILTGRPGLSWLRARPGLYVVARDGEDIGVVQAVRGHRRVRWTITPKGRPTLHDVYPTVPAAARALDRRSDADRGRGPGRRRPAARSASSSPVGGVRPPAELGSDPSDPSGLWPRVDWPRVDAGRPWLEMEESPSFRPGRPGYPGATSTGGHGHRRRGRSPRRGIGSAAERFTRE
jgi:hypothetical protein